MTVIDSEFQHLKGIREICFDKDVMAFLHDAQATLKYQGIYNQRGPFKRSLIHYTAMEQEDAALLGRAIQCIACGEAFAGQWSGDQFHRQYIHNTLIVASTSGTHLRLTNQPRRAC
ncbi:hypothetical protein N7524_003985 [Penicillium chrysogenum]|nr:hypothetical protein N7524_003985 [Penicillium chrysogenum]